MTPLDFLVSAHEDHSNTPAGLLLEAMNKDIEIYSGPGKEWTILSYYYDEDSGRMILDIEKKEKK